MLAAELDLAHALALITLSLLLTYIIVFVSGFGTGQHEQRGPFQSPLTETVLAYLLSLLVALAALYLFDRIEWGDPLGDIVAQVLVLGLPAAVGSGRETGGVTRSDADSESGRPQTREGGQQETGPRERSVAERTTLAISIILILGLVGLVTYVSINGGNEPPIVEAKPLPAEMRHEGESYYLPVAVTNRGGRTAQEVLIQAELVGSDGSTEETDFTLDFLAGGETRKAPSSSPRIHRPASLRSLLPASNHHDANSIRQGVISRSALGRAESGVPQQGDTTGGASVSERNKVSVRRLVEEVLNGGRMDVIDALYAPALAAEAKAWIALFGRRFPTSTWRWSSSSPRDAVVGRFTCSGTHLGEWLGYAPTGRRFEAVAEVSIYRFGMAGSWRAGGLRITSSAWSSSGCAEAPGTMTESVNPSAGIARGRQSEPKWFVASASALDWRSGRHVVTDPPPIVGVSTSTAGFAGDAGAGPDPPALVTSVAEFEGLAGAVPAALGRMMRGFFANGGTRAYLAGTLAALEAVDEIALLCPLPEQSGEAIAQCERRRDRVAILPAGLGSVGEVLAAALRNQCLRGGALSVGAGRRRTDAARGPRRGVYASGEVSRSPSGIEIRGLDDPPVERSLPSSEIAALVAGGVNSLRDFRAFGRGCASGRPAPSTPTWNAGYSPCSGC